MEAHQVRIHLEFNEDHTKTDAILLTTIRSSAETTTYLFPKELQKIQNHPELLSINVVKNACKVLTKRGQYRNIAVTLPAHITALYMDEDKNFVYKDNYLEELIYNHEQVAGPSSQVAGPSSHVSESADYQLELIKLVEKLTNKLEAREKKIFDLSKIHKQFVIEKFKGKDNALEWVDTFEGECDRNGVETEGQKIEVMRLFLEQNALEWYNSTKCKLGIEGTWIDWRNSFLETYSDKSWRSVHHAYTYKFINGSLMDYALKKERLLLETEPLMTDRSRINHIVVGLPFYVQDKLDKQEISTTEQLMNQLRRFSQSYPKERKVFHPKPDYRPIENKTQRPMGKRPCTICESRGYPERFHPIETCRNRGRPTEDRRINYTEVDEVDVLEVNATEETKN